MNKFVLFLLTFLTMLAYAMDPNIQLMDAARKGDIPQIAAALDGGANVNYEDIYHITPLMKAVYSNSDAVQFLIDREANVNAKSTLGDAVLFAIWNKKFETVKILLSTPNIRIEDHHLNTAIRSEEPELVKAFLYFPDIVKIKHLELARELYLEYQNNIEICERELEKDPHKKNLIISIKIDQEAFAKLSQIIELLYNHFDLQ